MMIKNQNIYFIQAAVWHSDIYNICEKLSLDCLAKIHKQLVNSF